MSVDITLLGGFSVVIAGARVHDHAWRRRAASDVVKLLALSEGRALHREQVLDALWPGLSPAAALPRLHQAAHYARSALGRRDGVVLRHDRVMLLPDSEVRVDASVFRRDAERALRAGTPEAATGILDTYVGELLPEDPYADWVSDHRETLSGLYERLQRLLRHSGRHSTSGGATGEASGDAGAGGASAGAGASGGDAVRPGEHPVVSGLARAAHRGRSRGLLLVIDDLAGADAASLRMLHHVAANITARGIGRVVELG